jgi:hypothetical protein
MTATRNFAWTAGQLGFASHTGVSASTFNGQTGNVPSPIFFVDSRNATLVIAPLGHFQSWTCTTIVPKNRDQGSSGWGCGTMNTVPTLPKGFESTTLLLGGVGVTDTMAAWGAAMQAMYKTKHPADLQTTKLGEWALY